LLISRRRRRVKNFGGGDGVAGIAVVSLRSSVPQDINSKATEEQEAQLSPSDRAMRLVSSNLASCHATAQKLLIQVLIKPIV